MFSRTFGRWNADTLEALVRQARRALWLWSASRTSQSDLQARSPSPRHLPSQLV